MVTVICFFDDVRKAFREVFRVLKPSGTLVVAFIDRASPLGKKYDERKTGNGLLRRGDLPLGRGGPGIPGGGRLPFLLRLPDDLRKHGEMKEPDPVRRRGRGRLLRGDPGGEVTRNRDGTGGARMTYDELRAAVRVPRTGGTGYPLAEIKSRYRELVKRHHPDAGAKDAEQARLVIEANRRIMRYVDAYRYGFSRGGVFGAGSRRAPSETVRHRSAVGEGSSVNPFPSAEKKTPAGFPAGGWVRFPARQPGFYRFFCSIGSPL